MSLLSKRDILVTERGYELRLTNSLQCGVQCVPVNALLSIVVLCCVADYGSGLFCSDGGINISHVIFIPQAAQDKIVVLMLLQVDNNFTDFTGAGHNGFPSFCVAG